MLVSTASSAILRMFLNVGARKPEVTQEDPLGFRSCALKQLRVRNAVTSACSQGFSKTYRVKAEMVKERVTVTTSRV